MNDENFFSINRLMEFGLGMSMAQQMIEVMNSSMKSMYIPGSIQTMPNAAQQTSYVVIDNQQVGPLNDSEIMQLIQSKKINKDTLAWQPGMPNWLPIEQIPSILKIIAITPPSIPSNINK